MRTNDNTYFIDAQTGKGFDAETFLRDYWQQKPVVIKHFFPDFADPIDENDLAGLAQESEVDARIISNVQGNWHVEQGPINDFDNACQGKWTLLVQGVDKYVPDVTPILDPFWTPNACFFGPLCYSKKTFTLGSILTTFFNGYRSARLSK